MERLYSRRCASLIAMLIVSGCQPAPDTLGPSASILFTSCKNTVELSRRLNLYLMDNGFETLDRVESAEMTGQIPVRAVDLVGVDARDDVVDIGGSSEGSDWDPKRPTSGFTLRVRLYHRPDLKPDEAFEANLVGAIAADFGCTIASSDRPGVRSRDPDLYRRFVEQERRLMSRYR